MDSTTNQLLHIYHTFCEAVDNGKKGRVVFCDISKAFDRVWHKSLLYKLAAMGILDYLQRWFTSYLSGRIRRVVIDSIVSDLASILADIHQGSFFGPLLILVYTNDIVSNINWIIRLFAADTSLYSIVENPQSAARSLNIDLETINKWATSWLVDFNPTKTTSLLIARKLNPITHPPLNIVLTETLKHKHLGLNFSSSCTWTEHINKITETVWTRLNLMRALKFKTSRSS